jgi:hypothetical protein
MTVTSKQMLVELGMVAILLLKPEVLSLASFRNSDIIASAYQGQGGNITATADVVLGFKLYQNVILQKVTSLPVLSWA